MAKRPPISTITSGYYSTTVLNNNFTEVRDAFDNTLSLDGSTPNAMTGDFDLNSNDILNVGSLWRGGVDLLTAIDTAVSDSAASAVAADASADAAAISETNAAASAVTAATFDPALYVAKAGDTMTGALRIEGGLTPLTIVGQSTGSFVTWFHLESADDAADVVRLAYNPVVGVLSFLGTPAAGGAPVEEGRFSFNEGAGASTNVTIMTREKGDARYVQSAGDTMTGVLTNTAGVNSTGTRDSAGIEVVSFKPTLLLKDTSTSSDDFLIQGDAFNLDFFNITAATDDVTSGTLSARIEAAGTVANNIQTVITREKGDARYALAGSAGTLTEVTEQATTTGTAFNFTSIPAGTTEIYVCFNDVSLTGGDEFLIQIGDAGGIETTGYQSESGSGAAGASSTTGFVLTSLASTNFHSGIIALKLMVSSTFKWVESHSMGVKGPVSYKGTFGGGFKSLSSELTQLRITRTGANTFDSGSVNILYR